MCFFKCIYVEFLDPKTRALAQAKIQLAELKMFNLGWESMFVCSLSMLKVKKKVAKTS